MMEGGRRLQKHLVPIQTRNILKTSRKCHSSLSRPIYSKSSLLVSSSRNRYKLVSKKANQFNIHRKFCSFQVFRGGQRSNIFNPFSLDLWDPFKFFPFSTSLSNIPNTIGETSAFANTRIDWKETPKAHVFRADLPGVKKEEVKVEVEEGRVLQISGKRSKDQEEKNNKWHRVERSSGKFFRRFRLPENAKTDEVKASMENGVPTVTVSKEEVKKAEVQAIEIST